MSIDHHDDNCPGCKPILLDPETNLPLPDDAPMMHTVMRVWAQTSIEERRAFHRVTVGNGQDPADLEVMAAIGQRIEQALKAN